MAWTYLLECNDGSFYVGSTRDLQRRLFEHQSGVGALRTKNRRPVRLVWYAEFERVDAAYTFEKQVRRWGRAKRLALIRGELDSLPALASRSYRGERLRASYEREGGPGAS